MKQQLGRIYRELAAGRLSQQAALDEIRVLRQRAGTSVEGSLLATTTWEPAPASVAGAAEYELRHVILCGLPRIELSELSQLLSKGRFSTVEIAADSDIARAYSDVALACFKAIQDLLKDKPRGPVLVQVVVASREHAQVFAGLSGLLETATLENPNVHGQVVLTQADVTVNELAWQLREQGTSLERVISYRSGMDARMRRAWRVIESELPAPNAHVFKEQGVYLITGGLGGLGTLFAREIQSRTSNATIILTGRSALTEAKRASLRALQQQGRVEYHQLDACDLAQVQQLLEVIGAEHGQLNGIIHSAGVLLDDFILKKSEAKFSAVLAPKVSGTYYLDLASESMDLDFLWLFSSIASWAGNVGQADYAAANGFMDEFAAYRNALVAAGRRKGHTLTLSWPHWLEGGMNIDADSMTSLQQRTGLRSLQTAAGMEALYRSVASCESHVMVMAGDLTQMRRALLADPSPKQQLVPTVPRAVQTATPAGDLLDKTREFLRHEFSLVLKIPTQRIDTRALLENYGIDSIRAMSLTNQLEATFGALAKTLFFEYLTIDELAGYFVQSHADKLASLFAASPAVARTEQVNSDAVAPPQRSSRRTRQRYLAASQPASRSLDNEPIAIVGLSGRYPESPDVEQFWINLRDGKDCIVEIPPERWDWRQHYSEDRIKEGCHYSKWGGFIAGVDEFDPRFFNIAPREAPTIDPQERLFLQHVWLAIEDAGLTRSSLQIPHKQGLPGQVGVYAGVMYGEYNVSGSLASIANRVSYFLNLHGPSLTLDTMCSSSLTAIHLACQDLRLGRTNLAIAGGVNVSIHPNKYRMLSGGQFISSDGHCQSFGEGGDGYIPGEGVGVAILKRLADAERDGNHIYGVIRSSALNHGGKTNGYTVPNPQAQADVIRQALTEANLDPRHVSYIEAHGTGTKLGDPIEVAALTKAFRGGVEAASKQTGYCRIGSAKSNIGHCESAAGIAGVTKVLLQMKHRCIVPSLHSRKLNPHIDFNATPFVVNQTLVPWEQPAVDGRHLPRIAGISSFGAGGSNAHVIIEEYQAPARSSIGSSPIIVPLSARTADQLQQRVRDLVAFIKRQEGGVDLHAMAYTLQVGREAMEDRVAFVVSSVSQLAQQLDAFLKGNAADGIHHGQVKQHKDALATLSADTAFQANVEASIGRRDLAELAALWVKGWEIDWGRLADGDGVPRLMSLPGYPFAQERYWIAPSGVATAPVQPALVHPLLHANTSNLLQQSYTSKFTGAESFLVNDSSGAKVLPPSVALEMVRAAVELASPKPAALGVWEVQDIAWDEPIVVSGDRVVCTALFARDNDQVDVEIYSCGGADETAEESIHCQSRVVFNRKPVSAAARMAVDRELLTVDVTYATEPSGSASELVRTVSSTAAAETNTRPMLSIEPREIALDHSLGRRCPGPISSRDRASAATLRVPRRGFRGIMARRHVPVRAARKNVPVLFKLPGGDRPRTAASWRSGDWAKSDAASVIADGLEHASAPASASLSKPSGISLRESVEIGVLPPLAKGVVTLSSSLRQPPELEQSAGSAVELFDLGGGIFSIEVSGAFADASDLLLQALDQCQQETSTTVLLLEGSAEFWQGDQAACDRAIESQLFSLIASFPWPVIAVAPNGASGAGLLLAAVCDFVVGGEEGCYGCANLSAASGHKQFLDERFGEAVGNALGREQALTGLQLKALGWACRMVPASRVLESAVEFAADLAEKPQLALRLLKAHLNRYLQPLVGGVEASQATAAPQAAAWRQWPIEPADKSATHAPGMNIPLRSTVVTAVAQPEGVIVVSLQDRAERNMFSPALVSGLKEVFEHIERTPAYKVVVLTGYDSYFATGGTRETLLAIQEGQAQFTDEKVFQLPMECSLPVIAAIQGHGIGGGWSFGMFSDLILLSEESRYLSPYMGYGFTPGAGSTLVFPKKIGYDLARETLLAAKELSGRELMERGIQLPVLPRKQVLSTAISVAKRMAAHSREHLQDLKQQWAKPLRELCDETYRREVEMHEQTFVRQAATLANIQARFAPQTPQLPAAAMSTRPAASITSKLKEMLAQELHLRVDEIEETAQFIDLGLDSITGVTWIGKINSLYGLHIEATKVYNHPTLAEFSRYVSGEMTPQSVSTPAVVAPPSNAESIDGVVERLKTMLAKELHLRPAEIEETAQFIDLGLDSITGVTWVRKINEHYGTNIEATKVYSHPTLREISRYVRQEAEQAGTLAKPVESVISRAEPVPAPVARQPQPTSVSRGKLVSWRHSKPNSRFVALAAPVAATVDKALQPIAVVGIAGQFPKARDLEQFWSNLAEGRNCIDEINDERWSLEAYFQAGAPTPGKTNSKWLGALDEYDRFDPLFFNISPTEAECMDPQQRLFLQACWHSIENAGYNPQSLSGSQCGVFVGCGASDYHQLAREQQLSAQGFTGAATSILAARISYFLNLRGPCVSLDTACSSSLVAIANACDSLNAGNSDVALAGGVFVMGGPAMHIMTAQAGMLSTDGRCFTFDQRANGFVPGEGVGVVMLKRLADAERDGDHIQAVIQGWGVNQDGRTNGITAPNEDSQTRLLQAVYRKFHIDPADIQLIEAHGTGTKLGDPIEVAGLKAAFKSFTGKSDYCAIGSVKSNIGHCLTAAGAAGFIKLILALKHRQLPPTINFERHNEHIHLDGSPFYVNDQLRDWSIDDHQRRQAAISSFGFSGTNAHIVVGEYQPQPRSQVDPSAITQDGKLVVCLSARTEPQLKQRAQDLLAFIRSRPHVDLIDVAYTSQVGREAMGERLAFLVDSIDALSTKLAVYVAGTQEADDVYQGQVKRHKEGMKLISQDDDVKATIVEKWLGQRKLGKLVDLWVKGLDLDWNLLYGAVKPKRIELPNYPFAKERYWLAVDREPRAAKTEVAVTPPLQHDKISYVHRWEEQPSVVQVLPVAHKKVLIVCTDSSYNFEATLRDHYEQHRDCAVLVVRISDATRQVSSSEWLCGVRDEQGFQTCLQDFGPIDTLYFLATTEQVLEAMAAEKLLANQESNEIQLLRLVKCLKQQAKIDGRIDAYIVTLDNHSLDGRASQCWGAGATGLGYSLAQGNHQFRVRNLDLSSDDLRDAKRRASLMTAITREPASDRGEVFKLHAGHRYRQTFLPLQWDKSGPSALKQHGVYLIVGGSGIVGQILTRNLLQKYRANVIWLGRSDSGAEKIQSALQGFKEFGNQVRYVQADVLNAESLERALQLIKQQHERMHGAIFSGMVFGIENSIDQTTEAEFRAILEVKTRGSRGFYEALRGEPLDFMCYFSSGQAYSFSGAAKLSAYATGITFEDSFVRSIQGASAFPVGSINWGFWRSAVKERIEKLDGVSTRSLDALDDAEGFERFERFVSELRQGRLHQVLCMRASREVESLMNCKQGEFVALSTSTTSATVFPVESIEIPQRIEKLQQARHRTQLSDWFARLLFAQLNRLVHSSGQSLPQTTSELGRRCKVQDKYASWLQESLNMLAAANFIELHGNVIQSWRTQDVDATWEQWRSQKQQYIDDPDARALTMLIDECLEKLPEILQGKVLATDVIFPNASMDKVAGLYRNNATADTFNEIVASAVLAYLHQRLQINPHSRLRILEIGAGTGGTSAVVFAKLSPFKQSIEQYCYTDISKAFFFHAERNYLPEHPYIVCQRLDIEQPVATQGIEIGSYDLVIATNALHATQDIRKTLRNAKAVLRKDGFIILNEMSDKSLTTHLTFGLLDGWWLFQDAELRIPGSPGLAPATWQRVLEGEGFKSVALPASEAQGLGNQVIIAQSDGIVRLQASVSEPKPQAKAVARSATKRPKQVAKAAPQDAAAHVRKTILECLSTTLKIPADNIEPDIAFSDYGIDSILGVSFIDQLNGRFVIALNTAIIFEYSSVERLARHIVDTYGQQIAGHATEVVDVQEEVEEAEEEHELRPVPVVGAAAGAKSAEIAIIGISGQFPKAPNVRAFWDNLIRGVDGVEELPARYLDQTTHFSAVKQKGKTRCKWGGILTDRDCFDPLFFNISPKEAESMNPHQRLVMQESWNAIEDAGYNPKQLSGTPTGIFIGAEPAGYIGDTFTGLSDAIIASRLSYALNFNGPAFVVNTGCSSSAVAIHLACESLRNRESELVVAGGVNACMHQDIQVRLDEIEMLSPSGRCYTFDKAGDGTIISEGIGMLVLKRLDDAIAAGDHIYATICGSGMNQDGASNGITAPNGAAQEQLILNVYDRFDIDAEDISYVEAHGTGTRLGDPIETNALVRAFSKYSAKTGWCAVGSAKSHIGHAAAAAGVIGIIKVLLSMQHRQLPKLLNFSNLNPLIEFDRSPFFITTEMSPWQSPANTPRMAAINSFGHSGTNVHLVVREYLPPTLNHVAAVGNVIVPLSAKFTEQLRQKCEDLVDFLHASAESIDLASLAYTLQAGREAMEERLAFSVDSVAALLNKIRAYLNGDRKVAGVYWGAAKRSHEAPLTSDTSQSSLIEQWVKGRAVAWDSLWSVQKPARISLPGYPFAKERYWIDAAFESKTPALPAPAPAPYGEESIEDILAKIDDDSLEAHEGVQLLRKIV